MISKQQYESQLLQIFKLLIINKIQEEIARELHISIRTVVRYSQHIEKRYGHAQRQKTDNTLFMECQLFKNRMFSLYKSLEETITSNKTSGAEKAKCAEVAANIAIDILKMESEGIKAVKQGLVSIEEAKKIYYKENFKIIITFFHKSIKPVILFDYICEVKLFIQKIRLDFNEIPKCYPFVK